MKARMTLKTQVVYDDLVDWCLAKKQDLMCLRDRKQKAREMVKEEEEDTDDATEEAEIEEEKHDKEEVTEEGNYYFTYQVQEYQYTIVNSEDLSKGAMVLPT
eukprot:135126_1